ncbi:MAG: 16S rRNA (uracil(1498)-N(3))-methyltransferase [Mariprofundaceae bacterium]|nr:16S rRNA (uracil(1498)-N(3))-methyltransferase [Mariprofundaceae bacterium]
MPHCRIYLNNELQIGHEAPIPADQGHYLRHVMRLACGDGITVFNGRGGEYRATISQLSRSHSSCLIESFANVSREMPVRIHIIQCANKGEKIETVLQKCTELGVASFQVTSSERSQFRLAEKKLHSRLDRWQRIIVEAAEQSQRTAIPALAWCSSLKNIQTVGQAYLLHPEAARQWQEVKENIATASDITLAVGPEGGWSRRDLETLSSLGFTPLIFGPRILRTETAAPALTAAIQAILN